MLLSPRTLLCEARLDHAYTYLGMLQNTRHRRIPGSNKALEHAQVLLGPAAKGKEVACHLQAHQGMAQVAHTQAIVPLMDWKCTAYKPKTIETSMPAHEQLYNQ
jgi:hypothetical protein